jgi:hypothetical protein
MWLETWADPRTFLRGAGNTLIAGTGHDVS